MRMLTRFCLAAACLCFAVPALDVPLGYQTLREESVDAPTVVKGKLPKWLRGYSIRQTCGSFGDIKEQVAGHYIDHFFDCIPAISQYKVNGKQSTFFNRYPDTMTSKIWKEYNMNMSASGIFFQTAFSYYNPLRVKEYPGQRRFPAATFWELDSGEIIAHGEGVYADLVHLNTLKTERYQFKDSNLGYPPQISFFLHNPAHDHIDGDITWSTTSVAQINPVTKQLLIKQAVYKLKGGRRTVFSEYTYGTADLTKCRGGPYPDVDVRPGYMHAFLMTKNYLIFPITAYVIDPCALFVYRKPTPLFRTKYNYYSNSSSKVLVMRKSDGKFVKDIRTEAFFSTHMLNAYETKRNIIADFLTFPDAALYQTLTFMDSLIKEIPWKSVVERFTIEKKNFNLKKRVKLTKYAMLEFSTINYDRFNAKPYRYGYIARRPSFTNGAVMKLNVRTRKVKEYKAEPGMILQEASFVQRPGKKREDDGVLLVHALDNRIKKATLLILDARKMKEIARIIAPQHELFGIHSKFFPSKK